MVNALNAERFLQQSAEGIVVDVRTPAEFEAGHIGGAVNLPLFTNDERAMIGTIYKHSGRDTAVLKGLECIGPRMAGMVRKAKALAKGRSMYLYCWRGGMRSGSVAWLLDTAGMKVHLLKGGYKAYRQSGRDALMERKWRFVVIGGLTGCGKTDVLKELATMGEQVLDLEGLAHHRGSAFGGLGLPPQPTNEQMGNQVYDLLRSFNAERVIWTEGESYSIGKVALQRELYDYLVESFFIYFSRSEEERLERVLAEYGGLDREGLVTSFENISKRLGYDRAKEAIERVEAGDLRYAAEIGLKYYDQTYTNAIMGKRSVRMSYDATGESIATSARRLIGMIDWENVNSAPTP